MNTDPIADFFENYGDGTFNLKALPKEAQLSKVHLVVVQIAVFIKLLMEGDKI